MAVNQRQGFLALRRSGRLADHPANRQPVAILHQRVPYVAELGRLAVALLVEPRLRIGCALMGLVGALLLVEAAFGVAAGTVVIVVLAVLAAEALDRRPRLDQRPVHREVIAR